jgi:preprotein translocase subunit YajC
MGTVVSFGNEKTFRDRGSEFMKLEIIIILLTLVLAVYFLFRPTSKKEKDRFEDKDNWRGGF